METIELRLNNFLFNSGVLGFYRIMEHCGKANKIDKQANVLKVPKELLQGFEEDYINTMLYEFEKDVRWYRLIQDKEEVEQIDVNTQEGKEKLKSKWEMLKKAIESASYKSGYEIIKSEKKEESNPYAILEKAKKAEDIEKKASILELIEHLKRNKEVYAMKDIIYGKINIFWENVSFLNKTSNRSNIKEEYKKSFVNPVLDYIHTQAKSDYNCIECGNVVSKTQATSLSWLKDTGVDINRKKSGFWNFQEDAFLCPICNLIYSCVPLGFYLVESNGIFINCNKSLDMLLQENNEIKRRIEIEKDDISQIQYRMFYQFLKRSEQKQNEVISFEEPQNIQVIKRLANDKDHQRYEFATISKEKLRIFNKTKEKFEKLLTRKIIIHNGDKTDYINIYDHAIGNFLENRKQYSLLNRMVNYGLSTNANMNYAINLVKIQAHSIGGIEMKEMTEQIEQMRKAGEYLRKFYYSSEENENKLRAYILNLTNSLRTGNEAMFMDIVTRMYGSHRKKYSSC